MAVDYWAAVSKAIGEWAKVRNNDLKALELRQENISSHAVVSLSQLIAYVNFQSRVLAGLRMLKGAA